MKTFLQKHRTLALLGVLLVSAVAWAVQSPDIDQTQRWVQGGLWVMPKSLAAQTTSTNKVTRMLAGSITVDFAAQTITCVDSGAITVTGAQVNDPCFVGAPAAATANSNFTCYVSAANTVLVRFCAAGTAADPPSATYFVRVVSNT